ncbi:MAG: amidohydrolase family protein [Bacteroidota bacterium]
MKNPIFDIKDADTACYSQHLKDFLPNRIIDVHSHVYLEKFRSHQMEKHNVTWPSLVAAENPIEDLLGTYRLMFPGKTVTPLIFSNLLSKQDNFDDGNSYIHDCAKKYHLPSLYFARPDEPASVIEKKMTQENFLGVKVYLSLADERIPINEITIFDYLPHHQLEVLNQFHGIVMLHIPRPGRLKDPVNLEQMISIEKMYPQVKLIIAHVGRAYCMEDTGNAFKQLAATSRMMFDFSANTNEQVFTELIKAIGPGRILFGSDLPITRMRMRRICEKGRYINIVPPGQYGNISNDPHMREATRDEGEKLSFFLYEEISAFKRAAEKVNLSQGEINDIFYNNAASLL